MKDIVEESIELLDQFRNNRVELICPIAIIYLQEDLTLTKHSGRMYVFLFFKNHPTNDNEIFIVKKTFEII